VIERRDTLRGSITEDSPQNSLQLLVFYQKSADNAPFTIVDGEDSLLLVDSSDQEIFVFLPPIEVDSLDLDDRFRRQCPIMNSAKQPLPEIPDEDSSLDLSSDTMRALGHSLLERIISHHAALGEMPAGGEFGLSYHQSEELIARCRALQRAAPEDPQPFEPLLDKFFDEWLPAAYLTPGPGYLAYVPGGGLFASALGEFLGAATNRFTGVWAAAPLLAELEGHTLDWLRDWMGFPKGTAGLLTSGGSTSNQNVIVVAREKKLGVNIRAGTMYVSDQVHHCVKKSARLAGIAADRIRSIETDARYRMCLSSLEKAIETDRRAGLEPFLVVSSAGTTNTGAIDPLADIGALARREDIWHHVDGAYGALFNLVPSLQKSLTGLSEADSLTLDPHKGLFLPYGTGALLVREGENLRAVHEMTAGYLPPLPDPEFYDPSRLGPELSRPFRGLPIWLAVQLHGLKNLRAAIAQKRELALRVAEGLKEIEGIELVDEPQLTVVPFRARNVGGRDLSPETADAMTRALMEGVNRRGRVYLSGATVKGRWIARVCVLCFRTGPERIEMALEDLAAARAEL